MAKASLSSIELSFKIQTLSGCSFFECHAVEQSVWNLSIARGPVRGGHTLGYELPDQHVILTARILSLPTHLLKADVNVRGWPWRLHNSFHNAKECFRHELYMWTVDHVSSMPDVAHMAPVVAIVLSRSKTTKSDTYVERVAKVSR